MTATLNAMGDSAASVVRLRRAAFAIAFGVAAIGGALIVQGGFIHAKAWAAQALIHRAWEAKRAGEVAPRPWPWADTHPLARLRVPALGVDQIVLAGASGRNLAFGPAQIDGTARPGASGVTVLTGHRDTHFAFVRRLGAGDELKLELADGATHRYRVNGRKIVHKDEARLADETDAGSWLVLATCWPFDALDPGTPWRYLVTARRE